MKLEYDRTADTLHIAFKPLPKTRSQEIATGVTVDFEAAGNLLAIHIAQASQKVDLRTLETKSLNASTVRIG